MNLHSETQGATRVPERIIGRPAESSGPGPEVMAASTLEGNRVYATDGVQVGHIKDIMLDVRGGRIAYAVLSSGGLLGIGDKLLAVPWHELTLDTDRKCFVLPVTSQQVREAPGFDRHHWPSFADAEWVRTREPAGAAATGWDPADLGRFDVDTGLDEPPHEGSPNWPESRSEPRDDRH